MVPTPSSSTPLGFRAQSIQIHAQDVAGPEARDWRWGSEKLCVRGQLSRSLVVGKGRWREA